MRLARVLSQRLRSIFRRSRVEHNLEDELALHLEQLTKEYRTAGLSESDARSAARREFGNMAATAEHCRDKRRIGFLEDIGKDLSYGLRLLAKSPGFTAVAVLSLALGIGANTATFGLIDALMLRTLPVRNPEQIVLVRYVRPNGTGYMQSYGLFQKLRGLTHVFADITAVNLIDRSNLTVNGPGGGLDEGLVRTALVSGNYFSFFGVNAMVGRALTPDDDRVPGGHPVAVISYGYWLRRFGLAADVAGRTFTLNGTTYTILGVTPKGFLGDWVGRPTDIWLPVMMHAQVMPEYATQLASGAAPAFIFARPKPGVAIQQAQAAAQAIYQQEWRDFWPNPTPAQVQYMAHAHLELKPGGGGYSPDRDSFGQSLNILAVVAGAILLIACANVANLLLARSAARQREMAVRLAIGAGRFRIVRQLLTESILLAAMGGALGMFFAAWGTNGLATAAGSGPVQMDSRLPAVPGISLDLHPDARAFGFATALCVITGILFGLAPAFRSSKASLSPSLSGRGASSSNSGGRFALGKLLVAAQSALSLTLLIGAGLFVRSLWNLEAQDLGIDRRHLLLVWTSPGRTGRQGASLAGFCRTVVDRIASLPGVVSASASNHGLMEGGGGGGPSELTKIEGLAPKAGLLLGRIAVTPEFFATAGMPLLAGRNFTERDLETAPQVAIINETMARFFFGHENAIGRRYEGDRGPIEIVGVVKDGKHGTPRQQGGITYVPYRQNIGLMRNMSLEVRTAGNPMNFAVFVRKELRDIDPSLPVLKIDTVDEQVKDVLAQDRLLAGLSAFSGGLAAALACLGLYGVMSYTVARRTNEIGIRTALGARQEDVLNMILKESLALALAGIAIGVPVALMTTRLIANRLFGISACDPVTIGAVVLLLTAAAMLAGFLPARRAARVDPLVALRHE
jgi:predicted permease